MRAIRIDKFLEETDDIQWLVEGLLPNVGWTLFYGLRGIGKTTLAMQLCNALQHGSDFMERKVKQTDVMYLQADSPTLEWKAILKRIAPKSKAFTVVDVPSNCFLYKEYVNRIENYIVKIKPGFVVFDSLYNMVGDNINTTKVLTYINLMKDVCHNIPWLLIHHPPHEMNRAAGHSSLGANSSNEWSLLKTKMKIEKGRIIKDKEILMARGEDGLWELYKRDGVQSNNSSIYNKPIT